MKYKIEELKDMTDSREMMELSPKGFSRYMTYIIILLLTSILIWSLFAYKEISINASGMVRPAGDVNKVSSILSGNISEINVKDGDSVKKGDTLMVINGSQYEFQKNVIQKSLDDKNKMLELTSKLKQSVLDGENKFDPNNNEEKEYIKKYELFMENFKMQGNQADIYKEQYIANLDSTISNLKTAIDEADMNLQSINAQLDAVSIKASRDGVINMISQVSIGDFVQSGMEIASIIPQDEDEFNVDVYINNKDFGNIKDGQAAMIEIASLPSSEYGYIKSNLQDISVDAKSGKDTSYYTAVCPIEETSLSTKKGESADIKNGMIANVRIINRKVTYFRYFLEMMGILN